MERIFNNTVIYIYDVKSFFDVTYPSLITQVKVDSSKWKVDIVVPTIYHVY